ncbi:MAG: methyltransferase [Nanoarchaeota archaeon]|nr:methyltransferase [Nanoarchaeota archaeon]
MSNILKKEIPELLEKNPDLKVLEIGAGSGIQLQVLLSLGAKKANIFSSDIEEEAVAYCNSLGFNCVQSDLFKNINGKYNVIIFNPPYLPEDSKEPCDSKTATTGGERGGEIINGFLKKAKEHLTSKGKIFLLTSSLTKNIKWLDYQKKLLGCEKLFFEELCVWEITS